MKILKTYSERLSMLIIVLMGISSFTNIDAKIFTIGDSTVQTYTSGYYPRTGWGQVLQYFFDENYVVVDNRAVGGTSSKSFYDGYWKSDGSWSQIVNELSAGDFVFKPVKSSLFSTTFRRNN